MREQTTKKYCHVPGRKYAPKGENVQKKYILLPKYLRISKKSSTFAVGFDLKGEW